jgi:ribosomal protein S18 acetylase RimI-like enzyme
MNWYEKLNKYFPIEEMKSKEHLETLLEEKGDVYIKDESADHVLLYVEDKQFIFIDYLYVFEHTRGRGVGKGLLRKLKEKQKTILLEVEPATAEDEDTKKRLRFYKREGFSHATSISYKRRSLATGEINELGILYWVPQESQELDEKEVFRYMKKTYERIHTYKDEEFYGEQYQPAKEVLNFTDSGTEDMLNK